MRLPRNKRVVGSVSVGCRGNVFLPKNFSAVAAAHCATRVAGRAFVCLSLSSFSSPGIAVIATCCDFRESDPSRPLRATQESYDVVNLRNLPRAGRESRAIHHQSSQIPYMVPGEKARCWMPLCATATALGAVPLIRSPTRIITRIMMCVIDETLRDFFTLVTVGSTAVSVILRRSGRARRIAAVCHNFSPISTLRTQNSSTYCALLRPSEVIKYFVQVQPPE